MDGIFFGGEISFFFVSFLQLYAGLCPLRRIECGIQQRGARAPLSLFAVSGVYLRWLLHLVFFHVIQAQCDDFQDDFHYYLFPVLFLLFSFHFQS